MKTLLISLWAGSVFAHRISSRVAIIDQYGTAAHNIQVSPKRKRNNTTGSATAPGELQSGGPLMHVVHEWIESNPNEMKWSDDIKPQVLNAFRTEMIGEPPIEDRMATIQYIKKALVIGSVPPSHDFFKADIGGVISEILAKKLQKVPVWGYNPGGLPTEAENIEWHDFDFTGPNATAPGEDVQDAHVFVDLRFGGGTDRPTGMFRQDAEKVKGLLSTGRPASITMMGSSWASPDNGNVYRRYDHIGYLSRKMYQYLKLCEFLSGRTGKIEPVYEVLQRFSDSIALIQGSEVRYGYGTRDSQRIMKSRADTNLFQNAIDAMHNILLWRPGEGVTKHDLMVVGKYKFDCSAADTDWVDYVFSELTVLMAHTQTIQQLQEKVHYASPVAEHVLSLGPLGGPIKKMMTEFTRDSGAVTGIHAALTCLEARLTGGNEAHNLGELQSGGPLMHVVHTWIESNPREMKWSDDIKPLVLSAFRTEMIGEPTIEDRMATIQQIKKALVIGSVPPSHDFFKADIGGVISEILAKTLQAVPVWGYNPGGLSTEAENIEWHDFDFNGDNAPVPGEDVQDAHVFVDLRFGGGTDRSTGMFRQNAEKVKGLLSTGGPASITMMGSSWASPDNRNVYRRCDHIGYISRNMYEYLKLCEFLSGRTGEIDPVYEVLQRFSDSRALIQGSEVEYGYGTLDSQRIMASMADTNLFQNAIDAMHNILLWRPEVRVTKHDLMGVGKYKYDCSAADTDWVDYVFRELIVLMAHTHTIQQLRENVHYASPAAEHVLSLGPLGGPINKMMTEFTRESGAVTATHAALTCLEARLTGGNEAMT